MSFGRMCILWATGTWFMPCPAFACEPQEAEPTARRNHSASDEGPVHPSGVSTTDKGIPHEPRFRYAVLLKPKEAEIADAVRRHLPLISVETKQGPRPHDVAGAESGPREAAGGVWTVYAGASQCDIAGQTYDQVIYVWCAPSQSTGKGGESEGRATSDAGVRPACANPHGLRITLASDGFAIAWEVFSPQGGNVVYASESLEKSATSEFGSPPPGRRFAVERPVSQTPDVVIPAILPDGPAPMGPYVYLEARPGFDFYALACRCSPSLVQEFVSTGYYDVKSLDSAPTELAREPAQRACALDAKLRWPRD